MVAVVSAPDHVAVMVVSVVVTMVLAVTTIDETAMPTVPAAAWTTRQENTSTAFTPVFAVHSELVMALTSRRAPRTAIDDSAQRVNWSQEGNAAVHAGVRRRAHAAFAGAGRRGLVTLLNVYQAVVPRAVNDDGDDLMEKNDLMQLNPLAWEPHSGHRAAGVRNA